MISPIFISISIESSSSNISVDHKEISMAFPELSEVTISFIEQI